MVRPIWLGALGIVFAAGMFMLLTRTCLFHHSYQPQNNSPISSYTVQADPKPLAKASADSPDSAAADKNTNTGNTSAANASPLPITKSPQSPTENCDADIPTAINHYTSDVTKAKQLLDSKLSFQVGLNISSQFVADYNDKVTSIFNDYQSKANKDNCDWPVKEPALLPSDYTGL